MKLWDGTEASTTAFSGGIQVAFGRPNRLVVADRGAPSGSFGALAKGGSLLFVAGLGLALAGNLAVEALWIPGLVVLGLGAALILAGRLVAGRASNMVHHEMLPQGDVLFVADIEQDALLDAHGDRLSSLAQAEVRRGARGGKPVLELVWPDGELAFAEGSHPSIEAQLRKIGLLKA